VLGALLALAVAVEPARVEALNAELAANASATAVLQKVCDRRTGGGTPIRARRVRLPESPSLEQAARVQLGAARNAWVSYRRVELTCGDVVFSRADNWYMPERLTPEMNKALEGDTPFGVVVRPLDFRRKTLAVRRFESALGVLQHRAVLTTPDGKAFSYLVETYTPEAAR
jgi:hypothetical protein